jgi:Ca2+-binding RTX toxin-like protein
MSVIGGTPKLQIVVTLGQSLSVGATSSREALSTTPRFPDKALALDFGKDSMLASGWRSTAIDVSSFKGFAPIREVGTETHVSGMIDSLIQSHFDNGLEPPKFLHINGGEGGKSILQLMSTPDDIYASLESGLLATVAGNVFLVSRSDGRLDAYFRNESTAVFQRTFSGPFVYFDNVIKKIEIAINHSLSLGYDVHPGILFNWIQGQSDSSPLYDQFLSELHRKLDSNVDHIFGTDLNIVGVISQTRAHGIATEQIGFVNDEPNFGFGATEYQFQSRFPSSVGSDHTHLSPEGYYLMGQQIGNNLFGMLTGQENKPILMDSIVYENARSLVVNFTGVDSYLISDDSIFGSDELMVPPSNMGFGVYRTNGGRFTDFFVVSAEIIDADSVRVQFNRDIAGDFRLYLGRTEEDLSSSAGVIFQGGTTIRDAESRASLGLVNGGALASPILYEFAPIQFVTVTSDVYSPPPPPPPPVEEQPEDPSPPPPLPTITVFGTSGSDTVSGTDADERIYGISPDPADLGLRQIDRLTGGAGNDLFVLGDARGVFYNRNQANSTGVSEYAIITDFSNGDRIQLATGETYFLRQTRTKLAEGVGIFRDKNGDGTWDSLDEVIAIVQGQKEVTFADVIFSNEAPPPPPVQEPPSNPTPPPPLPTITIFGTSGNNAVFGSDADEAIYGISSDPADMGLRQVDTLTGGAGNDLFVLGDARGVFYNRNQADSVGMSELAVITDFTAGDRIQLAQGTYFLAAGTINTSMTGRLSGTVIYHDKNGNGVRDSLDEIIGLVQGSKVPTMADIVFAGGANSVSVDGQSSDDATLSSYQASIVGGFGESGFADIVIG